VISQPGQPGGQPDPKKPTALRGVSWGLELRKQWSHQGLWRCMFHVAGSLAGAGG